MRAWLNAASTAGALMLTLLGVVSTSVATQSAFPTRAEAQAPPPPPPPPENDLRLALQGRYSRINVISADAPDYLQAPWVSLGARFLSQRLFTGVGFGFYGISDSGGSGFSISPIVNFDLFTDRLGAFYLLGAVDLGSVSNAVGNDVFFFGLNLGAGLRATITKALSVGGELGWEMGTIDAEVNNFAHGIMGAVVVEISVGL